MRFHFQFLSSAALLSLAMFLCSDAKGQISISWVRQFGNTENVKAVANDVSASADAVYVAGSTGTGALPGQVLVGGTDAFIRKYDLNGNELWTREFGAPGSNSDTDARGVSVAPEGVYIGGNTSGILPGQPQQPGGVFVRKYDSNGNLLWTRQFGGLVGAYLYRVTADSTGVYLAGMVAAALPGQTQHGSQDAFVRKYDPSGNQLWTRQFGVSPPANDQGCLACTRANAVSVAIDGVYVAGWTAGALPGQTSFGINDAFLRKYDLNGNELFTRQYGAAQSVYNATAVSVGVDGVYVISGISSQTGNSNELRKFDFSGNERWTQLSSGYGLGSVFATASGVFTGGTAWWGNAADYAFLREYDLSGNILTSSQFGPNGVDTIGGMSGIPGQTFVAGGVTGVFPGQTAGGAFLTAFIPVADTSKPVSHVLPLNANSNAIHVSWTGLDALGPGIQQYDLFIG